MLSSMGSSSVSSSWLPWGPVLVPRQRGWGSLAFSSQAEGVSPRIRLTLCAARAFLSRLSSMATIDVLARGDAQIFYRPCSDCGLHTGCYCDYCFAVHRVPSERWADGQFTPLCNACDNARGRCRFCRGVHMETPVPRGNPDPPSG